jgi:transposase
MKNTREMTKEDVILSCVKKLITEKDAAQRLKLSIRQVQRLKAKCRRGESFLHGNCGRKPAKTLPAPQKQAILAEYQKPCYKDVNFRHFCKLIEAKAFSASYTAVSNLLKSEGYKSPKKRKHAPKIHKTRERRAEFGELLQIDGTPHDWFDNGEMNCLHVAIDDARGEITGLEMSPNECLEGYFSLARQTLTRHGTPLGFYGDGLSILFSNKPYEPTLEEQLAGIQTQKTQFGRVCEELGVELIHAHSPQAKGRVERVNQTLQGRLITEFKLRGICDIASANRFLQDEYIDIFNAEFAVNRDCKSCFVPLPRNVDLDELLSWKTTRKVDKGCVFSLNSIKFKTSHKLANKIIEILISKKLGIVAKHEGRFYDVYPLSEGVSSKSSDSVAEIVNRFVNHYTLKNEHKPL